MTSLFLGFPVLEVGAWSLGGSGLESVWGVLWGGGLEVGVLLLLCGSMVGGFEMQEANKCQSRLQQVCLEASERSQADSDQ